MPDRCTAVTVDGDRCWLIEHDTLGHIRIDRGWPQPFTVPSVGFVNYDNNDPNINDQQPEVLRKGETKRV